MRGGVYVYTYNAGQQSGRVKIEDEGKKEEKERKKKGKPTEYKNNYVIREEGKNFGHDVRLLSRCFITPIMNIFYENFRLGLQRRAGRRYRKYNR